jgi:prepilin-type N-terminal cleavage/methylation domain-containing protein
MPRRRPGRALGFTLAELLVVIAIIGLLAATLLPAITGAKATVHATADARNLAMHYQWLETYRQRNSVGHLPEAGGHKFLLDVWVRNVIEHTEENLDRYFTPGVEDPHWSELHVQLRRGHAVWPELDRVTSADTHYAARAAGDRRGIDRGTEAWAANDNDGGWSLADGTVNVLWGNGSVRPLSLQMLMDDFGWPGTEKVFPTHGEASPHAALKKLAN